MNWFKQIFKKAQLDFPLSIRGLRRLLEMSQLEPDVSGQQYLIQGPETYDLQRLRLMSGQTKQKIKQMITMIGDIFANFGENMKDEMADIEHDESEIQDRMSEYVYMYLQDFSFRGQTEEDMFLFLSELEKTDQNRAWSNSLKIEGIPNQQEFNRWMGIFEEWAKQVEIAGFPVSDEILNEIVEKYKIITDLHLPQGEAADLLRSEFAAQEELKDAIARFTTEAMVGTIEYESGSHIHNRNYNDLPGESIPPWIDIKKLKDMLSEDFNDELATWYENKNRYGYGGLEQDVIESLQENDSEYFEEQKRALEHQFGFDVVEDLSYNWEISNDDVLVEDLNEFDDNRLDLELKTIIEIAEQLEYDGHIIKGASGSTPYAFMMSAAVLATAESDENLKFLFSQDVNRIAINPEQIIAGINDTIQNRGEIPEILQTETVSRMISAFRERQQREAEERERQARLTEEERQQEIAEKDQQEEIERQKAIANLREQAQKKKEYHHMLEESKGTLSPEQMKRMKELELAKKPFEHIYELHRGRFPGAGYFQTRKELEPFRISIAPTQSERPEKRKIPLQLFREMGLHSTSTPVGLPALGWVGGYADYDNKIMYVTEVQSDVMQRSVHMRDPKKLEEMKQKEMARLEKEIGKLQHSLPQQISPKEKMRQTLDRIRMETQELEKQNKDPQKIQKNKELIDRLLQQYRNIPETTDTSKISGKIQILTKQLNQLKRQKPREFNKEEGYYKGFPQWHEYKSKIENAFKEWIPIFFNVAVREAKARGFEKLRIISAESLKKVWAQYAKPKTEQLFNRIYNETAQRYGAKPMKAEGYDWFEMDLGKARFASSGNWFKQLKAMCKKAIHQWFVVDPVSKKPIWQIHLDIFFETLKKRAPELADPEFDTGEYARNENNAEIFRQWLLEVPDELKLGDDLEPVFKQLVRKHLIDKYNFDPYESEEEETEDIVPSVEELESWWSS